jgi:mercuric ion binding protein
MKHIRLLSFLLLTATSFASSQEQETAYVIGVDGLACPFCSYGVEKWLVKLDGVEQVETDIKLGQVIVRMIDGETLQRIQVEEAIEKTGFSLRSFGKFEEKEEQ